MTEYFYPDDVIVTTAENGKRVARLGYEHILVYDGSVNFSSLMPVTFTDIELDSIMNAYHKAWIAARERNRKEKTKLFMDQRDIVASFWKAHRTTDNTKWTVSEFGKDQVTMEKIMNWYNKK